MKMKEKGISAVGIVVIVIVIAAGGIGAYFLLAGGGGGAPGGLPEYPGATGYDLPAEVQAQLPAGVQVKGYNTSASVSDIMTWYKGQMPGQGWTIDNTHSSEAYGILYYTKGNDGAMILAISGATYGVSGTVIVLATGPSDTLLGT